MTARRSAALAILVAAAVVAYAAPASAYVPSAAAAALAASGEARASSVGDGIALKLAPDHPSVAAIRTALAAADPDVVVEALFLWKKPRRSDPAAELLAVYNILRAVGSLQGIEYFSASRGRRAVLFEESWLTPSMDDRTALADTSVSTLPARESLSAWQRDASLGGAMYRYDLASGPDWVSAAFVNATPITYGFLNLAAPGTLHVRAVAVMVDEGVLLYLCVSVKPGVLPGLAGKFESSFGNRVDALYAWFTSRAAMRWPRS